MANTKPNWTRDLYVVPLLASRVMAEQYCYSWPARLPQIFSDHGLVNIVTDCRMFEKDAMCYQLDTALAACEEISYNALDPLGDGKGSLAREMIQKVFRERQKTAFNVGRLTAVGRKPPRST